MRTLVEFSLPLMPNGMRTLVEFSLPLVPNGRYTLIEFSLTTRAERQSYIGRVFTHPTCLWPLLPFLSNLPSSPLLEDLGDYMNTIGKTRDDARIRVRMSKIKDKQVPNQEVPS
ncbi:unnamed protein product [Prunus armeniaca]